MTIAVGVLAGNSIVLASDTEHTYEGGEIKGNDTKIMATSAMDGNGAILAATGIVGAGYTDYVNAIRMPISQYLSKIGHEQILRVTTDDIRLKLEETLREFYDAHVMPFYQYDKSVEFDLLIAARFHGLPLLFASGKTAVRPVIVSECIGCGRSYGTGILNNFRQTGDVAIAVMQACCTVFNVKETVKDCGKSTQILCLTDRGAIYISEDLIQEMEALIMHHSQWQSNLLGRLFGGNGYDAPSLHPTQQAFARLHQSIRDMISPKDQT